jgi:hypothetical protein
MEEDTNHFVNQSSNQSTTQSISFQTWSIKQSIKGTHLQTKRLPNGLDFCVAFDQSI